jgi:hypothetical protein
MSREASNVYTICNLILCTASWKLSIIAFGNGEREKADTRIEVFADLMGAAMLYHGSWIGACAWEGARVNSAWIAST